MHPWRLSVDLIMERYLILPKKCKEVIAIQGRGDMTKFHSIVLEGAKFGCTD